MRVEGRSSIDNKNQSNLYIYICKMIKKSDLIRIYLVIINICMTISSITTNNYVQTTSKETKTDVRIYNSCWLNVYWKENVYMHYKSISSIRLIANDIHITRYFGIKSFAIIVRNSSRQMPSQIDVDCIK